MNDAQTTWFEAAAKREEHAKIQREKAQQLIDAAAQRDKENSIQLFTNLHTTN